MKIIGNLLWLLLGGIIMPIPRPLAGLLLCVTIIGIPFGVQCFKIAGFSFWPFGREVELGGFGVGGMLGNIIWILICGIELCLFHMIFGLLMCITIVGIPPAMQHFKLARLALMPFGARII